MRWTQFGASWVLIPALLAGCAAAKPNTEVTDNDLMLQAVLNAEDLGIQCERTHVVGYVLPKVVCTTAEQREENQLVGRKFLEDLQNDRLLRPH